MIPAIAFFNWGMFIQVTCGSNNNMIIFGADSSASWGFDPGVDVPFFPPPTGGYGYFALEDSLHPDYTMLSSDYRTPESDTIIWDFELGGAIDFTISWDTLMLPEQGEYFIGPYDVDSGLTVWDWQDMQNSESINIMFLGGQIMAINSPISSIREHEIPESYELSIAPNPFNATCRIIISGEIDFSNIDLEIVDIFGNRVRNLQFEGKNSIWDGKDYRGENLPSGMYFLKTNYSSIANQRIVLIR